MNETGAVWRLGRVLVASGLTAVAVAALPVAGASADPYPPVPVLNGIRRDVVSVHRRVPTGLSVHAGVSNE